MRRILAASKWVYIVYIQNTISYKKGKQYFSLGKKVPTRRQFPDLYCDLNMDANFFFRRQSPTKKGK